MGYTKKGEIPYGCPSLNKNSMTKHCDKMNEKAPFYCDIYETVIYETYVREIFVTVE